MGSQYGPYVMYFLSQLMQKRQAAEASANPESAAAASVGASSQAADGPGKEDGEILYFTNDETQSVWVRQTQVELLDQFCPEGASLARNYGHFLIGQSADGSYIAIPGRFLLAEQPGRGTTGFTLWQPLRGGEAFCGDLEQVTEEAAEQVYGYWIARIDAETLEISEV